MTRAEVCKRIEAVGIVPVVRAPSPELALLACEAILAGGISVFEITMTIPDAPAVIRALRTRLGDRALIGAGTVLDAADARACIEAAQNSWSAPASIRPPRRRPRSGHRRHAWRAHNPRR